jgi:hypothetical protein
MRFNRLDLNLLVALDALLSFSICGTMTWQCRSTVCERERVVPAPPVSPGSAALGPQLSPHL